MARSCPTRRSSELYEARDCARSPAAYEGGRSRESLLMRLDAAALAPVVEGEQPLFVRVERAADIRQALSLKREFTKLKLVLVGVSEGWMVAERIDRKSTRLNSSH